MNSQLHAVIRPPVQIYPEQLTEELARSFRLRYLILGGDQVLCQESVNKILQFARSAGFGSHLRFSVDGDTDWDLLFELHRESDLFAKNRVLILEVGREMARDVADKLIRLSSHAGRSSVLVVCALRSDLLREYDGWCGSFCRDGLLLVRCDRIPAGRLGAWIASRSADMGLDVDESACRLLQQLCGDDLAVLSQKLFMLSAVYPDMTVSSAQVRSITSGDTRSVAEGDDRRAEDLSKFPPDLGLSRSEVIEPLGLLRILQGRMLTALKFRYHLLSEEEQDLISPARRARLDKISRCVPLSRMMECVEELIEVELTQHQLSEQVLRLRLDLLVSTFRQMISGSASELHL